MRSTDPAVMHGATLFYQRGCEFCHSIEGNGGRKGPDLSQVGSRMTEDQIEARITNGGPNSPPTRRASHRRKFKRSSSFSRRGADSSRSARVSLAAEHGPQ